MKNLMISIIVPTYNHEAYIAQCLDSILAQQTNFEFEIILGEDESTDRTRQICKDYAERFPEQIQLFLRSRKDVIYFDGSPTGRFNFMQCLKASKGKYIALCEGDDFWTDPQKLQKQVDFLESHPDYSFCFTRQNVLDQDTGEVTKDYKNHNYFQEDEPFIDFNFTVFDKGWSLGMQTLVFRKEAFPLATFQNYKYFRDVVLVSTLLFNGKGACLNTFSAMYRKHQLGLHTAAVGSKAVKRGGLVYGELFKKHKNVSFFKNRYVKYQQHYINDLISESSYGMAIKAITSYSLATKEFGFFTRNLKKLAGHAFHSKKI